MIDTNTRSILPNDTSSNTIDVTIISVVRVLMTNHFQGLFSHQYTQHISRPNSTDSAIPMIIRKIIFISLPTSSKSQSPRQTHQHQCKVRVTPLKKLPYPSVENHAYNCSI